MLLTYNLAHILNYHITLITKFFLYIIPSNCWATEWVSGRLVRRFPRNTPQIKTTTQQRVKGGSGPFPGPFDTIQRSRTVEEADLFNSTLLASALYVLARSGVWISKLLNSGL